MGCYTFLELEVYPHLQDLVAKPPLGHCWIEGLKPPQELNLLIIPKIHPKDFGPYLIRLRGRACRPGGL